jgi:cell pole-organizing protein PopZ
MSNPEHEPTMEEILASIRKIISEDSPEVATAPEDAAPQEAASHEPETIHEDVLELTHEVVEMPAPIIPPALVAPPEPEPEPQPQAHAEPDDVVFETVTPEPAPTAGHDGIFSDHTRKAMEETFASIPEEEEPAPAPAPRAAAPIPPLDGASVENVFERAVRESFEPVLQKYISDNSAAVIERMKPLIREWMDEHFPALLEGAVRAEVERVVKARGTKR